MLDGIRARDGEMRRRLRQWAEIHSGTENLAGVEAMRAAVADALRPLADSADLVELPPRRVVTARGELVEHPVAAGMVFRKRAMAARRVLLCGHLDTVYGADSAFRAVREIDNNTWNGPGVADLKGGLVVLCEALRAFEQHPAAGEIGWSVLLNTDEEVGSPSSVHLLQALAAEHEVGLVFEPSFADGTLVGTRGGSANYDLIVRGKSAHVGRDYTQGRSAIHVAAEAVGVLASLNAADGVTVNVGKIDGGGPSNVVAELAVVRLNVRVSDAEKQTAIENDLRRLAFVLNRRDGIAAELHGGFLSPPKPLEGPTLALFELAREAGRDLGIELAWRPTGGVCDGNKLQAAGLPTIDTLGVRGGNLHSPDEFVLLDSLVERATLTASLLVRLAKSENAKVPTSQRQSKEEQEGWEGSEPI